MTICAGLLVDSQLYEIVHIYIDSLTNVGDLIYCVLITEQHRSCSNETVFDYVWRMVSAFCHINLSMSTVGVSVLVGPPPLLSPHDSRKYHFYSFCCLVPLDVVYGQVNLHDLMALQEFSFGV